MRCGWSTFFVDELDLGDLGFGRVEPLATGRPGYHPCDLLKLYIYGTLNRVQSSRRLEREAGRNVEVMWLVGRLQHALEAHGLRRVFTFHLSVAAARAFTSEGAEGIRTHLPEFQTFHVNGKIPTALRDGIMGEFRSADRAVVSNARCLTEGVDVPAVDLVAFMSP